MTCRVCSHINEYTATHCANCGNSLLVTGSNKKNENKKAGMFAAIQGRDDAEKIAKDCGNGFFAVAAIQGVIGAFIAPSLIFDAVIYALCGYFVRFKHSRVAAVILLLVSGAALIATVMNKMGQNVGGGNNIILAVIVVIAAVRAVEATFKLNGRYKESSAATENI